jgi:hypothetical protein
LGSRECLDWVAINTKAATALGLTIPPALRTGEVIQ